MPDKNLSALFKAVDTKDRKWYKNLSAVDKKAFSPWLAMRWISSVTGNSSISEYYVMAVNETTNKNFNRLNKHPNLQYLLLTTSSPAMGKQHHAWVKPMSGSGMKKSFGLKQSALKKLFPLLREYELDILDNLNDLNSIKQYMKDSGWTDKEIKNALND